MSKAWFRQKRYGFGAAPASWEGWAVTAAYLAAVIGAAVWLQGDANDISPRFGATLLALTLAYVAIAWRTTEGGWRWRWGRDR